jgi:hypothetical protein
VENAATIPAATSRTTVDRRSRNRQRRQRSDTDATLDMVELGGHPAVRGGSAVDMQVHPLGSSDVPAFWALRLRGFRDDPEAFNSSWEEASPLET